MQEERKCENKQPQKYISIKKEIIFYSYFVAAAYIILESMHWKRGKVLLISLLYQSFPCIAQRLKCSP